MANIEDRERGVDAAMDKTKAELKAEIDKSKALLSELRSEVREKLLLRGEELKAEWKKIEVELQSVERAAERATNASRDALRHAVAKLRVFRSKVDSETKK